MDIISESENILHRVTLVTVIKITGCDLFYHETSEPYVQFSVDGLALDGLGYVAPAHIEDSASYGDETGISELRDLYSPGALYVIESNVFCLMGGKIYFYNPINIKPVASEHTDKLNTFFATGSMTDGEPGEQHDRGGDSTSCAGQDGDGDSTVISGILEHLRTAFTKSGQKMAFARLKDNESHTELVIFPNIHEEYEEALLAEGMVSIRGRLDVSGESSYFIPEKFDLSVP